MKRAKRRQFGPYEIQFVFFTRRITLDELIGLYPPTDADIPLIKGEIGQVDCGIRFVEARDAVEK